MQRSNRLLQLPLVISPDASKPPLKPGHFSRQARVPNQRACTCEFAANSRISATLTGLADTDPAQTQAAVCACSQLAIVSLSAPTGLAFPTDPWFGQYCCTERQFEKWPGSERLVCPSSAALRRSQRRWRGRGHGEVQISHRSSYFIHEYLSRSTRKPSLLRHHPRRMSKCSARL